MIAALTLFGACAGRDVYTAKDLPGAPPTVVLLPFDNETTSFEAAARLRGLVAEELGYKGYSLMAADEVDAKLKEIGISEGGQLGSVLASKLGSLFGVDGLIFGSVEAFDFQNLGFVRRKVVRLRLRLVDAKSGERLWEAAAEGSSSDVTLEEKRAGRRFLEGVVEQAAEKLAGAELHAESRAAARQVLSSYPRRY